MPRRTSSTLPPSTDAPMVWYGWGDPARRPELPAATRALLAAAIGPIDEPVAPIALDAVRLPASGLTAEQELALREVVGDDGVRSDRLARVEHAGGKSYPDLLRRLGGDATAAPDAVVLPADHDQVRDLLRLCVAEEIAVVPFGGGTSVVGGVEPARGRFDRLIAVDFRRMRELLELDKLSRIATFQPGARGVQAETLLRRHGLTLGHFPQSYEYATLGGYAATRSAGQASSGYGRIDDLVTGLVLATPAGDLRLGRVPASAAGPDLLRLVLGSEGILGCITSLSLKVRQAPAAERYEAWTVPSLRTGAATLRELAQAGVGPDVCRLSDEDETRVTLAQVAGWPGRAVRAATAARGHGAGSLLVLGWEGTPAEIARRRRAALPHLRRHRLARLGQRAGRAWARHRFEGPYLRDALLAHGVMVETLETAAAWSRLDGLYTAVRETLGETLRAHGTPPLVMCHISHVYPTGASLYFTWLARQRRGAELEQWRSVKRAASEAIVAAGGTITHHHGVGLDHQAWLPEEVGDLGVEVLRAVKARLDPLGILNPGKLLPPSPAEPASPAEPDRR